MRFNFNNWDLGGKSIFIASCLAVLSMFFKWVSFGIFSENGFGQGTVIFLAVFIYPLLTVLREKAIRKNPGYLCAAAGIVLGIYYISKKSVDLFGAKIQAASSGPYIFIAACVILAFGVFRYDKHQTY